MISISNEFKTAMKQPVKEIQAYINGDISIKSEDDLISFKISCETGLTKTAMRKLEAKYTGEHNLLGQWVHVGYGVKLSDGTYEYLDYGSFLVSEITTVKDTGITTIKGQDKMINSMTPYTTLDVEYPIGLYDYTKLLCEACSLELGNESFLVNNDYPVNMELWENIEGITYRDIFVQIAQATGTTCIISNDDKVYFKPLTNTGESLTYDNLMKLKLEPKYGEINSVVLGRDPIVGEDVFLKDEESILNNGLTEFKIDNNQIIDKDRESAITPIYEALHGVSYYPFEATTEGLGWYEIGDNFNIINDTGDVYNTSLFNYSVAIDGSVKETLKSVAETKTQSQYQYATSISKRVKNTEIIVNKQEEYIQQLVSDMYEENGVVNENFTKVYQNVNEIVNSVQNSGGSNLIKNSVMFAYDNDNVPSNWNVARAGKNLFDKNDTSKMLDNLYFYQNSSVGIANGTKILYIPCKPNTTYTVSKILSARFIIGYTDTIPANGVPILGGIGGNGKTSLTTTTSSDAKYLCVFYLHSSDTLTAKEIEDTIQIEESPTATAYEPYTEGELTMTSNTESLNAGCLSGHSFTLGGKKVDQRILVSMDTVYSFSTNIKKKITGSCYVKLYNDNEEHIISLGAGEEAFYKEYTLANLQPKDSYYIVEFYGSVDSEATFTDNMLAVGEYSSKWSQANGEIMNTQVNVTVDGVLVKSTIYQGDYTVMSPLEFAGYSNINGTITKVFTLNKDTTYMTKAEVKDQFKMSPIKIVPRTTGARKGWAFVPVVEEASE